MDKDYFSGLDDRIKRFADRAGYPNDEIRTVVVLGNGRVFALEAVVEAADAWVQLDVKDLSDDVVRSLMLPYYQIHYVLFEREKVTVTRAGFAS